MVRKTLGLVLLVLTVMAGGSAQAQVTGCPIGSTTILGCYKVDGTTITVSGGTITAVGASASSISVGVTTVGSGTSPYLLYNNSGTLGNESFAAACTAATTGALGCVKVDGTTITISSGVISAVSSGAVSSVSGTAGEITVSPTTGAVVVSLPATITASETISGNWAWNGNIILNTGVLQAPAGGIQIEGSGAGVSQFQSALTGSSNNTIVTPGGASTNTLTYLGNGVSVTSGHVAQYSGTVGALVDGGALPSGANPTATAGPSAINGSSANFMRADAAPAVQKATGAQFGIVEVDGTTITESAGVITAIGGSATSITVGTTTVGSATNPYLLYNNNGVLGNETFAAACTAATAAALGCVEVDNATITASAGIISGEGHNIYIPNAGSTGTTVNKLAKLTGAPSTAVITATTDPPNAVAVGIVTAGAGTSGTATIQVSGIATCVFDGATVAGHAVGLSTGTAGDCHDLGASPGQGQIIGTVLGTIGSAGNAPVNLNIPTTSAIPSPGANTFPLANASSVVSWQTMSGDATLNYSTGAITVASIGGNPLALGGSLTFANMTATNDVLYVSSSGNVGQETFSSACSAATTSTLGCVKPDGTTITVSAGVISAAAATTSSAGIAKLYNSPMSAGWLSGANPDQGVIVSGTQQALTITAIEGNATALAGGTATIDVYDIASGTATCQSGTKVTTSSFNGNTSAGTPQSLLSGTYSLSAGHSLCIRASSWPAGPTSIGTISVYGAPS